MRVIMSATALVLGSCGAIALFLPQEVGAFFDLRTGAGVVVQVVGAGLLAIATLDWMGRGAIYGGVFGRPIILANLMFGTVSSLSLVTALVEGRAHPRLWGIAALLGLHALAFGYLLRSPPYGESRTGPRTDPGEPGRDEGGRPRPDLK